MRTTATKISFDLADVLTANELKSFRERAEKEDSKNLTDHFKKVFLGQCSGTPANKDKGGRKEVAQ